LLVQAAEEEPTAVVVLVAVAQGGRVALARLAQRTRAAAAVRVAALHQQQAVRV